jgi:LysM repeat protein
MTMLGIRPEKQTVKSAKKHTFKKRFGAAIAAGIFTTVFVTAIDLDENVLKARAAFLDLYTIQKGDTLFGLAQKFNSSVEDLKKVNHLDSDLIITGDKLIIPSLVQQTAVEGKSKVEPKKQNLISKQEQNQHIVKQGETVFSISNQYKVSMDALIKENGIENNHIINGQKLYIPITEYIVKQNDTLHSIAKQNSISVSMLKKQNQLTSNTIKVGQTLFIPAVAETNTKNEKSKTVSKAVSTSTKTSVKKTETTSPLPIVSLELINATANR